MSLPEHLKSFADNPIKFNGENYVRLVDIMGDDAAIAQAARVSYGKGTKTISSDRNLIRYLMRHQHTSPFEMCEIKLQVQVQNDIWKHVLRHRTANVNETSTRYSEALEVYHTTTPNAWRLQSKDNKQGSNGFFDGEQGVYLSQREETLHEHAREVYEERLKLGVAREQARKDLPLSFYTQAVWKIDAHNLMHFLNLRMAPNAQLETRLYANAVAEIVKAWLPITWEAFEDYVLGAVRFTRLDMLALKEVLAGRSAEGVLKGRELREFLEKIDGVV